MLVCRVVIIEPFAVTPTVLSERVLLPVLGL